MVPNLEVDSAVVTVVSPLSLSQQLGTRSTVNRQILGV